MPVYDDDDDTLGFIIVAILAMACFIAIMIACIADTNKNEREHIRQQEVACSHSHGNWIEGTCIP